MPNPNVPADHFMPGLHQEPREKSKLYQIVAPDGRVVVNFLPHHTVWAILQLLTHHVGGTRFVFQEVPADQLGVVA
ncbi:hypothetical protein WK39_03135 [Burkholderia cepacia]|uniref:hypothetical protein n=1 Tax=Burkholderia cepacia TaxID=292 RepID=UPI00075B8D3D|nr:hypothetical protein [Burkholderia cepacia]KVS53286.1 hypothetical protein WK39_03135 [Burkholderia cepacia]KVS57750.1 hypothetical protein WK40_25585 [Burkholderia cepacia]CAG9269001.1 hypothetical protein BCEP4_540043 [Burkholderia cepacia]